ncbi:MAG: molybdenum cofactor guanylyltransferase [Opitutaceae bacterium]
MNPTRGVVLAGGRSRRMGEDKASIVLNGRTLLERSVTLLRALDLPVTVCARREQVLPDSGFARVDDPEPGIGPVGGLLAAMTACPGESLLVIAVDLPRLEVYTLDRLLDQRDPAYAVTAYRSPGDTRVEPLCAIYEPAAESFIRAAVAAGRHSLRQILEDSGRLRMIEAAHPHQLIDLDTPGALANLISRSDPTMPCQPST